MTARDVRIHRRTELLVLKRMVKTFLKNPRTMSEEMAAIALWQKANARLRTVKIKTNQYENRSGVNRR